MSKILELIGFALIGGTIVAFLGISGPLKWPVFWACAGGALVIILLRKKKIKNGS